MTKYALLIDTKWCTGCHSCEVACQVEHAFPIGQFGIKLNHVGPWEISEDNWQDEWVPVPTKQCDTCASRRSKEKLPSCVQHCQPSCIEFGEADELLKKADGRGVSLFVV